MRATSTLTPAVTVPRTTVRLSSGLLVGLYLASPVLKSVLPLDPTAPLAAACALLGALAVVATLVGHAPTDATLRALLLLVAFALLVVVGSFVAFDRYLAREATTEFLALVALPSLAGLRLAGNRQAVRQLLWVLFVVGGVAALSGLGQIGNLGRYDRLAVFGLNPTLGATFTLLAPLIGLSFLWPTRPALRPLLVLVMVGACLAALASGSRGPVVMAALAVVLVIVERHRSPVATARLLVLVATLMVMVQTSLGAAALPEFARTRFVSLTSADALTDASVEVRLAAFDAAWHLFRDAPVLGVGTRGYQTHVAEIPWLWDLTYPHNLIVQTAAEYGLVGLGVVGTLLVASIMAGVRWRRDPVIGTVALLVWFALLLAMVSGDLLANRLLWLLAAILLAAPRRAPHAHAVVPSVI